ncbi:MAG: hypothetical protein IJ813_03615 [Bacteroidales bacterium]|nr:hypothetical protein [Bacteroidales bacterium]
MKTKERQTYISPESNVLEIQYEGPLCQSGEVDISLLAPGLMDMAEDPLFEEVFI